MVRGGYAWQFTGYELAALIGYRALGVNYTNTGNNNNVDLVLHGPIIGFSVRF
jgi:ABC-type proline/glycine betaine transport system permease subunit